jgi:N-acetylmuramic acid 6-phosphate etherase
MVNVRPTNAKLVDRAERIISAATGADRRTAAQLLKDSGDDVKTAILMARLQLDAAAAREKLAAANGVLSRALQ